MTRVGVQCCCASIALCLLQLATAYSQKSAAKGIVLGSGQWSAAGIALDDSNTESALKDLRGTGATWVRIIPTGYFANTSSPIVYSMSTPKFYTDTPSEVLAAVKFAKKIGLRVLLSPVIDPDWTIESNCRASECTTQASRLQLGKEFGAAQWSVFFASYRAWLEPYVTATAGHIDMLSIGAELQTAAMEGPVQSWTDLCNWARNATAGMVPLTYAAMTSTLQAWDHVSWLQNVDVLGVDAYYPLNVSAFGGGPPDLMQYWPKNTTIPPLESIVRAWQPMVIALQKIAKQSGKPILFSEVGYQARYGVWRQPAGVMTLDPTDGSCWERAINTEVQAVMYDALLTALEPHSIGETGGWWAGVFWWIWRTDPTAGGTCDDSFVPTGKPAQAVLARHWGGNASILSAAAAPNTHKTQLALAQLPASPPARISGPRNSTKINSAVYGGGMWSSPYYRLGSAGANQSLDDLRAVGANYVRFIVNWFVDNATNATTVWPANGTSHLRSDTLEELQRAVAHAKSLGMGCHIAPYIDPNFDDMRNCRGPSCGKIPGTTPKAGRGATCSSCTEAQWADFFQSYGEYIVLHAKFAQDNGCDILSIGSELSGPFDREQDFRDLIAKVKKVYDGKITIAVNSYLVTRPVQIGFLDALDFVGVEGYFRLNAPKNATLAELQQAWLPIANELEKFHNTHNKDIMFTEVGYQSRLGSHLSPASTNATDPEDCSATGLCADTGEQARVYEALLATLYPRDWFLGVNWWLWRADPTAGGETDYTFTPQGKKDTLAVMRKWYTWYA
eukprot:m.858340 g.858340  ORF g.858340 m.858340 type:complete len:788 (+) comp23522_c0_seq14:74-2437(+)